MNPINHNFYIVWYTKDEWSFEIIIFLVISDDAKNDFMVVSGKIFFFFFFLGKIPIFQIGG